MTEAATEPEPPAKSGKLPLLLALGLALAGGAVVGAGLPRAGAVVVVVHGGALARRGRARAATAARASSSGGGLAGPARAHARDDAADDAYRA